MGKFGTTQTPPNRTAPIRTTDPTPTHVGSPGWSRDARSDLFLLAATNLVREQTYHEDAAARDARFEALARQVAVEDPGWLSRFLPFLRGELNMRSAAVVLACEALDARRGQPGVEPLSAAWIDAACQRADEPAEVIGYWLARHGRALPMAVKRGVARAVRRLYTERSALKYDAADRAIRMGDVIELVHPKPRDAAQGALFRYLLDVRHHPDAIRADLELLPAVRAARGFMAFPVDARRLYLREPSAAEALTHAGFTWERLSGWLQGPMDAEAWEAIIPSMGYMALLRNLRNFDQAPVSDATAAQVARKLADPAEVARSRQLPIRFYSAWKNTTSMRWGAALEVALDASLANVPELAGRTLILIDLSPSMDGALSARSTVPRREIALVFGVALARRCASADVVVYSGENARIEVGRADSVLRGVQRHAGWRDRRGGTYTFTALNQHYRSHDRIVILTDDQAHDAGAYPLPDCSIYTFNLAGYGPAHMAVGERGRYEIGGLSDAAFRMVPLLEAHRNATWPF